MARFYGTKIKNGKMALAEVPKLWRKLTENWLEQNGQR
jgi:hypothetical protein